MIRAAIIGCGPGTPGKGGSHSFAYAHGSAIRATEGVELVSACSRTGKNVDDFCREFPGTSPYRDFNEMLTRERPDLVSICAHPPDREAMVIAALESGAKALWIEKPMALSVGGARRMLAAADEHGARLFVNHQRRYGKPFEWFRDAVQQHRIGNLRGIHISQPNGSILDFGSHLVDAALFALGNIQATRVFAAIDTTGLQHSHGMPVERFGFAIIRFGDRAALTYEFGAENDRPSPVLRAEGTAGFAELHLEAGKMNSIFRAKYVESTATENPPTNEHFHHSEDAYLYMKRALADIVQCLRHQTACRIDASEGIRSLELLLAIYRSHRERRTIDLPLAGDVTASDVL